MNATVSGGITGAANPTTKSMVQAATPKPMRILKARSPSMASRDGLSKVLRL
jgi:hypothetical protein